MGPAPARQRSGIAGSFCLGGIFIVFLTRQALTDTLHFSVPYTENLRHSKQEKQNEMLLGYAPLGTLSEPLTVLGESTRQRDPGLRQ